MLSVENLCFSYSKTQRELFRDFSLEISEGGVYGLLGRN